MAKKGKRPNRSAAARRDQYDRAHARVAQTLIKSFVALDHRGCRRTKLGNALLLLLSTQQPADHGAENSMLYAGSQPWEWQYWPQAEAPWPRGPEWCPVQEQVPLVPVPVQANCTPSAAAPNRRALGPAEEDLESNWSFSCTSAAPDGRFRRLSSFDSHEDSAVTVPHRSLDSSGQVAAAEAGDREAEAPTAPAATAAAQPVSLSKSSPLEAASQTPPPDKEATEADSTPAATAAVQQSSLAQPPPLAKPAQQSPPGKAEDKAEEGPATTALTSSVGVQQVSPSATSPLAAGYWQILARLTSVDEIARYRVVVNRAEFKPSDKEALLEAAADLERTLDRRQARARQRQGEQPSVPRAGLQERPP